VPFEADQRRRAHLNGESGFVHWHTAESWAEAPGRVRTWGLTGRKVAVSAEPLLRPSMTPEPTKGFRAAPSDAPSRRSDPSAPRRPSCGDSSDAPVQQCGQHDRARSFHNQMMLLDIPGHGLSNLGFFYQNDLIHVLARQIIHR